MQINNFCPGGYVWTHLDKMKGYIFLGWNIRSLPLPTIAVKVLFV